LESLGRERFDGRDSAGRFDLEDPSGPSFLLRELMVAFGGIGEQSSVWIPQPTWRLEKMETKTEIANCEAAHAAHSQKFRAGRDARYR